MEKRGKILLKSELNSFIKRLQGYGEVVAPVRRDILRYDIIKNASEICLDGLPRFSLKGFFFPQKQLLFRFRGQSIQSIEEEKKENKKYVFFAIRECDSNAFFVNDKLFMDEIPDERYKRTREGMILIALHCNQPVDRFCFCESMEFNGYYDLLFYDLGDRFHIKIGSEKGEEIVKSLKEDEYWHEVAICKNINVLETKEINNYYNHPEWKKFSEDCLSCGMCTNLCPTCLCFDISDELSIELSSGKRKQQEDSCQYRDFTVVAGGSIFRKERVYRFKHRIYHKLQYFKERFGIFMCTGCGRCIRHCPSEIYWTGGINLMHRNH